MTDELWPGGPRFRDDVDGFPLGGDSLLLAQFAKGSRVRKKRVADLGCGAGIVSILLAWNEPNVHIDGIEIRHLAASLAAENIEVNGFSDRISIIEGDIRRHRELFSAGAYDMVVSNPPYYKQGSGKRPESADISTARSEDCCTFADICSAAGYLTRNGGAFVIVHKPERLVEIFRTLTNHGFEPKRAKFVHHTETAPPSLVLIESRRAGKPSLEIEPPSLRGA